MKLLIVMLSAFFVLASADDDPKLKLRAPNVRFMKPTGMGRYSPVNISVTGRLEGEAEDPEEYYCLAEVWDWDDDTQSSYEPDCDPYEEGTELKRFFSATHTFRVPGTYEITLYLKLGKKTIVSGRTRVSVRGS